MQLTQFTVLGRAPFFFKIDIYAHGSSAGLTILMFVFFCSFRTVHFFCYLFIGSKVYKQYLRGPIQISQVTQTIITSRTERQPNCTHNCLGLVKVRITLVTCSKCEKIIIIKP